MKKLRMYLVEEPIGKKFYEELEKKIDEGWVLYGNTFVNNDNRYCQLLTKIEKEK